MSTISFREDKGPKRIDFAIDLETLATSYNAAIISIALKPFSVSGGRIYFPNGYKDEFFLAVDATSCIMQGMDVDPGTCYWWAGQSKEAKEQFKDPYPLRFALGKMIDYVQSIKEANGACKIRVWSQGTDFDIPILRNACRKVGEETPWHYNDVVDARTFIREGIRLLEIPCANPYDAIPPMDGYVKHDAMSDVNKLIHNVTWVNGQLKNAIMGGQV